MAKNLTNFNDFQSKRKTINETKVNEGFLVDDVMRVPMMVDVPVSLLKAFATKVKNETGQDIHNQWSDSLLSDEIAKYVISNFLNIENLPVNIITGNKAQAQGGKKGQGQSQVQPVQNAQNAQNTQQPVQAAPAPQGAPAPSTQQTPQNTAQVIPSQEQK
jgi:hypothetical protein